LGSLADKLETNEAVASRGAYPYTTAGMGKLECRFDTRLFAIRRFSLASLTRSSKTRMQQTHDTAHNPVVYVLCWVSTNTRQEALVVYIKVAVGAAQRGRGVNETVKPRNLHIPASQHPSSFFDQVLIARTVGSRFVHSPSPLDRLAVSFTKPTSCEASIMRPILLLIPVTAAGPALLAACEAVCAVGFAACVSGGVFMPGVWTLCGVLYADCVLACAPAFIMPVP
jgi:hypothetical protein